MLSKEEFNRYQKQIILEDVGFEGQVKIKQAKVVVIGAGGLGCPVLQYLTSMGVGTIGIVDFDTVEISNLHRQILYSNEDIGKSKALVAAEKLSKQNPSINIIVHNTLINESNAEKILFNYDIIVDGCDNFMTRYVVNTISVNLKKTLVYGSILGYEVQIATFNYHKSKNLTDLFPEPPNAEDVPNCSENGVLGSIPAICGSMMAQETINVILDTPTLTNKLLLFNCKKFEGRILKY